MEEPRLCAANIGYKGNPKDCGQIATMRTESKLNPLFLCSHHAVICSEQTGAHFVSIDD